MTTDTPIEWNAHVALEFHKCSIRSAYIEACRETKCFDNENFEGLKERLHSLIEAAEKNTNVIVANRLNEKISKARADICKLNN